VAVLVVIVVAVIAELYVIVQVAHHVGILWTLALLLLISASGPWLVRRTGLGVWRRARVRLNEGQVPGREIVDGVLLLAAGLLLTVPGFLSGVAGVLLLLPPARAMVRRLGARWLARRAVISVWSDGRGRDDSHGPAITTTSRPVEHRPRREGRVLNRGVDGPGNRSAQPHPPDHPDLPDQPHSQDKLHSQDEPRAQDKAHRQDQAHPQDRPKRSAGP
jgi:UPF0716 protein FxsA